MTYISFLGSAPANAECAQLGEPYYYRRAMIECRAYKDQLIRVYKDQHGGASPPCRLEILGADHDFGRYYEICAVCSDLDSEAIQAAFWLESNLPADWDDIASREIQRSSLGYRRVILESPYAAPTQAGIEENLRYGRECLRDSLLRGEAPIAFHLLYTQPGVLNDSIPEERDHGISAGLAWLDPEAGAEATVVYTDLGISSEMKRGTEQALKAGRPVEYRKIR